MALDHLCIKKLNYFHLNSICLVPTTPNVLPNPFNFLSTLHPLPPSTLLLPPHRSPPPGTISKRVRMTTLSQGLCDAHRSCGFGPSPRPGASGQCEEGWAKLPLGCYSFPTCSQGPGRKGGCSRPQYNLAFNFQSICPYGALWA